MAEPAQRPDGRMQRSRRAGLIAAGALALSGALEGRVALGDDYGAATASTGPLPAPVPAALSGFRSVPAREAGAMIELTEDGLRLPRIAPDGWMPWIAHARRFDPSGPAARFGLLMINVGASEPLMKRAIEELPGEVSLAFLPGTPDLARWLQLARAHGHESYLMLPVEDPGAAERGLRPIETGLDEAENLRRLRAAMGRGEGYVGLVISSPGPVPKSEPVMRALVGEIADRGLALVEVNPTSATAAVHLLTEELGVGYARSADVLDYKLSGESVGGNLERLSAWVAESPPDSVPRHAFGVVQPDEESISAIAAWHARQAERPAISLVPIIGHFECRDACMNRLNAQPAQLRP